MAPPSVNPARSTGPALFVGDLAVGQLWLLWIAQIAGAVIAGGLFRATFERETDTRQLTG